MYTKNDFQKEIVNHYFLIINTIETIIALITQANPIIIAPNKIGLSERLNKNSSKLKVNSDLTSAVVFCLFSLISFTSSGIIVTG